MKVVLPAGTRKVLLIDMENISRNADRGPGVCAPVVSIAEVSDDGIVHSVTRGLTVTIKGDVQFLYSQHAFLFVIDRIPMRGAWVTNGEVVVDDDGEAEAATTEALPAPQAPAAPRTRNARKTATETATEEVTA